MSTHSTRPDGQEVDLFSVSKGIGNAFRSLNAFIYRCLRMLVKNIFLVIALFIVGAGLGYLMDKADRGIYTTQMIVAPNFGSTDYLYTKVELIQSKIKSKDTEFFNAIGVKNPEDLLKIEVGPIIDVYKFVNNSGSDFNYRMIELMAQDGDFKKVASENTTSKNYPYHQITFVTSGPTTSKKTVEPLLAYLNDNPFYKQVQAAYLTNVDEKVRANDTMIAQIDRLLKGFGNDSGKSQSVYINENTQLNDVIKTKDELVKEQGIHRVDLVGLDKVVKENAVISNIKDTSGINGKMKFILPLLFIFLFICFVGLKTFYKTQAAIHNNN